MKVRRGEVVEPLGRVPVLPLPEVVLNDGDEPRILKEIAGEPVQRRGPARDGGGEELPAGLQDPPRLAEGAGPVGGLGQVIQRAQQEDDVGAAVGEVQGPSVSDATRGERPGLGDAPTPASATSRGTASTRCTVYPASTSQMAYAPAAPPPTSSTVAGGRRAWRSITSRVRSASRRNAPARAGIPRAPDRRTRRWSGRAQAVAVRTRIAPRCGLTTIRITGNGRRPPGILVCLHEHRRRASAYRPEARGIESGGPHADLRISLP